MRLELPGCLQRYARLALALCALLLHTACDPLPVPVEPNQAELYLDVGDSGDASLDVILGGDPGEDRLIDLAQAIGPNAFPTASRIEVVIDDNYPGTPFAVITAESVYVPGPAPSFALDASSALVMLREAGYTDIRVVACFPGVPRSLSLRPADPRVGTCAGWHPAGAAEGPLVELEMMPDPWRGWLIVALDGVVIAAGIAAWLARRGARRRGASARARSIGLGIVALFAFVVLATRSPMHGIDNLTVSGAVASGPFAVGSVVIALAAFLALGLGLYVLVASLVSDQRPLLQQHRS